MQMPPFLLVVELLALAALLCPVFKLVLGLVTGGLGGPVVYCPECGFKGQGKTRVRGSFAWELLLWCFFVVPGICYSIWRVSDPHRVCARCNYGGLVALKETGP